MKIFRLIFFFYPLALPVKYNKLNIPRAPSFLSERLARSQRAYFFNELNGLTSKGQHNRRHVRPEA